MKCSKSAQTEDRELVQTAMAGPAMRSQGRTKSGDFQVEIENREMSGSFINPSVV